MSKFLNRTDQSLPLHGVQVIDFGQHIAGSAVAMILGDLGATVVHIGKIGSFDSEFAPDAVLNRNKLCVELDLKSTEGIEKALELICFADVVIDSFRPGVMKKLGIDYQTLRETRPGLITMSIPGFPSNDPVRSGWKATEAVILATAGAFTDMGFNRVLMGLDPSFSPLNLGSSYAISLAAGSIVCALFSRLETGMGDEIEVPVIAATMEGLSYNSIVVDGLPNRYKCMREKEIERRRASGTPMDVPYENLHTFLDPCYRTYKCADNRSFYVVAPSHQKHVQRFLKLMGVYDGLIADGFPDIAPSELHQHNSDLPHAQVPTCSSHSDESPALASVGMYPICQEWADRISPRLERAFLTKSAEEWAVLFGEQAIPGTPHRTTEEWVFEPHNHATGLIVELTDPVFGKMKIPGPLVWLEESGPSMVSPRPRRLVDFEEALECLRAEHATGSKRHSKARSPSSARCGWLDGVRVLDLTNVIAGPHSCACLARYGAEVTKLEPVVPTYEPLVASMFTYLTDIGKKKVLLDITCDEGRQILRSLVENSDVVVINAVERQLKSLGLDAESLREMNPSVLFTRLDAFGGPIAGATARSNFVGYDDVVQSFSGIMSRFGGPKTPEEHAHLGTLDVNCGFSAALATAVALYHRRRTGSISRARTSLSAASNLLQIKYAHHYTGRLPFDEPSGRGVLGYHPLKHFYETANGWVFLDSDGSAEDITKLSKVHGLGSIAEEIRNPATLGSFLRKVFKDPDVFADAEQWARALHEADIAAAERLSIATIRDGNTRRADGTVGVDRGSFAFSEYPDHPGGRCVTVVDHYAVRPTVATIKALPPAQVHGADTRSVLASLGHSDGDIDGLIERKVVALKWGDEFMPA